MEGEWRQYNDAFVGVVEELCGRTSGKGGTREPILNKDGGRGGEDSGGRSGKQGR